MDFNPPPSNRRTFKSPVSLQSLQEGTEIILDTENADISSDDDDECFSEESFQSFKAELGKICTGSSSTDEKSDLSSFEVLSKKMNPITEDGLVRKLELRPGCGAVIPRKSVVVFHYNAYLEKESVPFDSTYQRNSPFRFLLGDQRMVLGLDIGIATMKKGEVASFLVHHDYAYGPMGCPPRVPPKATVYYEVEALSYVDSCDAIEYEQMTTEQQRRAPFEKILSVGKAEHQMANSMYQQKIFGSAAKRYQKAAHMLEDVLVANEEEDVKRQALLLKSYTNLALCYLKLNRGRKCRMNAQKAFKLEPRRTKALYILGKSYRIDGEYDEALTYLYKAQSYDPYDVDVNKEISLTEKEKKRYKDKEKVFWENAFGGQRNTDHQFNEPKEFIDSIKECVKDFKESSEKEYHLSSGYTPSQLEDIKTLSALNGIFFVEKIHDGKKISKFCK